ncbi:hypothetical protein [Pannonibacter sp. SL95]|uniref:hypothetical protein n=1 Tax=Pannonibacter sp. SL95 TaxID=2995153 RepID=UPI0022745388|nr:hypothetical protein [Pannonibacter sp. SL95]MCY1708396.1 hypothetical protein [Pannonibacter sp. SL95]
MNRAVIEVKAKPFRLLSRDDAAAYCGLPPKRFEALCPVAAILHATGKRVFDVHDLDRWIDGLKANAADTDADILDRLG